MNIVIYPKYTNPYQELIYEKFQKNANIVVLGRISFQNFFYFFIRLLFLRFKKYEIFHLHWQDFNILPATNSLFKSISFLISVGVIFYVKILKYKLVWTVHNIVPHEKQTINDLLITKIAARFSDHLIFHSKNTFLEFKEKNILFSKYEIIPLGNFITTYENKTSKQAARRILNLKNDSFVFLFLGIIRPYKGVTDLIETFTKLYGKDKNKILIIAGENFHEDYHKQILALISTKNVLYFPFEINDSELQYYFNSADAIVFPFREVTTSSSVVLALSFAKPVIAPYQGSIQDIPQEMGLFYDVNDPNGLKKSMIWAKKNKYKLPAIGRKGYSYIKSFTWNNTSQKLMKIYQSLSE